MVCAISLKQCSLSQGIFSLEYVKHDSVGCRVKMLELVLIFGYLIKCLLFIFN